MANIAADMFLGRERFASLLLMRLTETVILWLSEDQSFWDDIVEGPRPLGPLGLQQVCKSHIIHWNLTILIHKWKNSFFITEGTIINLCDQSCRQKRMGLYADKDH